MYVVSYKYLNIIDVDELKYVKNYQLLDVINLD